MKPSNEFCINFLKASGWLDNHDKQIRADAIEECIKTIIEYCGGLPNNNLIDALERLKEQKNELGN